MEFELSEEQNKVIEALKDKNNVICDSVAGSGKTTTILGIAKAFKDYNICMLTYNAKLKLETRTRANDMELNNIEVNSYHSFCCKHYLNNTSTDEKIRYIIDNNIDPKDSLNYTMLIIDEIQDMTPLYYELVCKIAYDNNKSMLIVVTGDSHQSIYSFNLADERYLIFADQLFKFNKRNWIRTNLSISYRTTKPIAEFLNKCVLHEDRIISIKDSKYKPRYLICNSYMKPFKYSRDKLIDYSIYNELKYYLDNGYKPGDIFIISPSIKTNSPIRELINTIKANSSDIKIFSSMSEKLEPKDLEDKLVFITYHQAKGLERKVCIVYGFDSGYFEVFNDNIDCVCPNEIYVALTRSTERLSIIHHNSKGFIQFTSQELIDTYCDVITDIDHKKTFRQNNKRHIKSNELTDYTPEIIISSVMKNIKVNVINGDELNINIKSTLINKSTILSGLVYYYIYNKYHVNIPLRKLNNLIPKNRFCSEYHDYERNGIIEFVENVKMIKKLNLKQFIRLYYTYYCCNMNMIREINDSWDFDEFDYQGIFNNLDKVFNFSNIMLFDKLFAEDLEQHYIEVDFNQEKILQDVIDKFDIKDVLKNGKETKNKLNTNLNKIFFDVDNQSKIKVSIDCHIDILSDNYLTIINVGDKVTNEDVINCSLCAFIFKSMYRIKDLKVRIYNPILDQLINVEYDNFNNCYSLLLLNRYIGFKQLTSELFIENNLEVYNSYFEE